MQKIQADQTNRFEKKNRLTPSCRGWGFLASGPPLVVSLLIVIPRNSPRLQTPLGISNCLLAWAKGDKRKSAFVLTRERKNCLVLRSARILWCDDHTSAVVLINDQKVTAAKTLKKSFQERVQKVDFYQSPTEFTITSQINTACFHSRKENWDAKSTEKTMLIPFLKRRLPYLEVYADCILEHSRNNW